MSVGDAHALLKRAIAAHEQAAGLLHDASAALSRETILDTDEDTIALALELAARCDMATQRAERLTNVSMLAVMARRGPLAGITARDNAASKIRKALEMEVRAMCQCEDCTKNRGAA